MKKALLVLFICLVGFSALGFSAVKTEAKTAKKVEVICPVTGTKITPATAYDKMVYKGKTYYFCCSGCKPLFQKNPEKYIKQMQKLDMKDIKDMKGMKK